MLLKTITAYGLADITIRLPAYLESSTTRTTASATFRAYRASVLMSSSKPNRRCPGRDMEASPNA